jgi:hypothetical protein
VPRRIRFDLSNSHKPRCRRPARPDDPVFQRRQRSSREAAAYRMPRMKRGMTAEQDTSPHPRRATRPSFCRKFIRAKQEGAGKAGCQHAPMVRVQQKSTRQNHRCGRSSGLPCAMVLRLIRDLPGDHAFLPPSSVDRTTDLAPASERQDHTISPSAQPPLVAQTLRPAMCVHRIPCPTSVTIAIRPSCGPGQRKQ